MKSWEQFSMTAAAAFSCLISFVAFVIALCFEENFFDVADVVLSPITKAIPDTFVVSESFDIRTRSFREPLTSTLTSFIGLLEATYRQQGITNGYLNTHELVQFSDTAFAQTLSALCQRDHVPNFCKYSDSDFSLHRLLAPTLIYFFETFPGLAKSVVPKSVCENDECESMSDYLSTNPLSFRIEHQEWAKSVRDIKEMLYRTQRPAILSIPNPEILYRMNKSFVNYPSMTLSGEFFLPEKPAELGIGSPVSFLLYGWNDGFVPAYGAKPLKAIRQPKGGFIVKGLFSEIGHSIPFLASDVSSADDVFYCRNSFDALTWNSIGAHKTNRSDISDSDILICINESLCSPNAEYALIHTSFDHNPIFFEEQENGIPSVKLAKFENGEAVLIDFNALPLHMLHRAFRPKQVDVNDDSVCGYWFIPYDLIEQLDRTGNDVFNRIVAMSLNISWSEDSFAGQSDAPKYAEVVKSTTNVSRRIKTRSSPEMIMFYSELYRTAKERFL